jgi:hypothetical protein
MAILRSLFDVLVLLFFVTHIPITIFVDSQAGMAHQSVVMDRLLHLIKQYETQLFDWLSYCLTQCPKSDRRSLQAAVILPLTGHTLRQ